jgi:hypothetical protein
VGQYGSIAGTERLILSVKNEHTRIISIPLWETEMRKVLVTYAQWYNQHRPHQSLDGLTPLEVRLKSVPIRNRPKFEPRKYYPVSSTILLRGHQGDKLDLIVMPFDANPHLPIIELKKAA